MNTSITVGIVDTHEGMGQTGVSYLSNGLAFSFFQKCPQFSIQITHVTNR